MNNRIIIIFIALIGLSTSSCERDDLCIPEDDTTPRMIVIFTDRLNPSERKDVASLRVNEVDRDEFAPLNRDGATSLTQVDSIALPLRSDQGLTDFTFIQSLNQVDSFDDVAFEYEVDQEYISRACGFKSVYENLITTLQPNADDPWIDSIIVLETEINDNQDIHVEIRH
ncbi:DUF6452 family protein [Nonlabens ponticola]|uniref:Uncharacterized protein n=1 Tax=Nonlabens ponticola TaxID=2496866 RepID=A0A3S9MX97_9FLAO|nr:DUF6452 family protein [Nonlabens ponticola]AZQ43762.1 hypothetical protein EJ995_05790 [Nonlabens ponticola]